jgi:hypothetical protein
LGVAVDEKSAVAFRFDLNNYNWWYELFMSGLI